jgi:GAF domain-containing protein
LVLPLIRDGALLGVLDLDSPVKNRFGERDELLLREIADIFMRSIA